MSHSSHETFSNKQALTSYLSNTESLRAKAAAEKSRSFNRLTTQIFLSVVGGPNQTVAKWTVNTGLRIVMWPKMRHQWKHKRDF